MTKRLISQLRVRETLLAGDSLPRLNLKTQSKRLYVRDSHFHLPAPDPACSTFQPSCTDGGISASFCSLVRFNAHKKQQRPLVPIVESLIHKPQSIDNDPQCRGTACRPRRVARLTRVGQALPRHHLGACNSQPRTGVDRMPEGTPGTRLS
jgi:hypothetical protein